MHRYLAALFILCTSLFIGMLAYAEAPATFVDAAPQRVVVLEVFTTS